MRSYYSTATGEIAPFYPPHVYTSSPTHAPKGQGVSLSMTLRERCSCNNRGLVPTSSKASGLPQARQPPFTPASEGRHICSRMAPSRQTTIRVSPGTAMATATMVAKAPFNSLCACGTDRSDSLRLPELLRLCLIAPPALFPAGLPLIPGVPGARTAQTRSRMRR